MNYKRAARFRKEFKEECKKLDITYGAFRLDGEKIILYVMKHFNLSRDIATQRLEAAKLLIWQKEDYEF